MGQCDYFMNNDFYSLFPSLLRKEGPTVYLSWFLSSSDATHATAGWVQGRFPSNYYDINLKNTGPILKSFPKRTKPNPLPSMSLPREKITLFPGICWTKEVPSHPKATKIPLSLVVFYPLSRDIDGAPHGIWRCARQCTRRIRDRTPVLLFQLRLAEKCSGQEENRYKRQGRNKRSAGRIDSLYYFCTHLIPHRVWVNSLQGWGRRLGRTATVYAKPFWGRGNAAGRQGDKTSGLCVLCNSVSCYSIYTKGAKMKRYLCLEGMGDSTSPMILTRRLSVDVSRGGREWSLSHRGKWGWGWVAADREPPRQNMCLWVSSEAIGRGTEWGSFLLNLISLVISSGLCGKLLL